MLAADGKLFVVTEEGRIHCFGTRKPGQPGGVVHGLAEADPPAALPEDDRFTGVGRGS